MKAWDKEFYELMNQFEKDLKSPTGIYFRGSVERSKPDKDGKVPGGEFYNDGELSKLFNAYMLGYSYRACIANSENYDGK